MRNVLTGLALIATLGGCIHEPYETKSEEEAVIVIPEECEQIINLGAYKYGWNLTCKTSDGKEIFFHRNNNDSDWNRYEVERKNNQRFNL